MPAGLHVQGAARLGGRRARRPGRVPHRRAGPPRDHARDRLDVEDGGNGARAVREHPDRFAAGDRRRPEPRAWRRCARSSAIADEFDLKCVGAFPAGLYPQVAVNDKKWFPIYTKCVELDIPFASTMGVPGPAHPVRPQDVAHLDEVCWYFPELRFVTRHGCEPWTELAVKLMLKWPNLYYSTTAFAPKHYPKDVIDYANTRGADKIIWSGYFPAGLTLRPDLRRATRRARSATTSGRSSSTRTPPGSSSSTADPLAARRRAAGARGRRAGSRDGPARCRAGRAGSATPASPCQARSRCGTASDDEPEPDHHETSRKRRHASPTANRTTNTAVLTGHGEKNRR